MLFYDWVGYWLDGQEGYVIIVYPYPGSERTYCYPLIENEFYQEVREEKRKIKGADQKLRVLRECRKIYNIVRLLIHPFYVGGKVNSRLEHYLKERLFFGGELDFFIRVLEEVVKIEKEREATDQETKAKTE